MSAIAVRSETPWRRPSAYLPPVLSAAALGVIGFHLLVHGLAPQSDEGAAARLWQLLMVAQAPIVLFFACVHAPRQPRRGLVVLGLQVAAALAALAPVAALGW